MIDVLSEVWTGAFINMLLDEFAIGVRADVEVIVLPAAVTDHEFVVSVLYSVDVLSGVLIRVLISALTDLMIGFVCKLDIKVLVDVDANVFATVMAALNFAAPIPLE